MGNDAATIFHCINCIMLPPNVNPYISPVWSRFENGLPHAMIWDMQIDRGATTLSVWPRGRGAYVWPLPAAPLNLTSVVSRKTHGAAGTFDVDLTNGNGIECRSGGPTNDYTMILSFSTPITNCGVANSGTASSGPNPNQCSVQLSVPTGQYITAQLTGVIDTNGSTGSFSGTMGVLVGDTTANGLVNSTDISQTQSQSGQPVTSSNFREDVTVNGLITSSDVSLVQSQSGTGLPPPPPPSSPTAVSPGDKSGDQSSPTKAKSRSGVRNPPQSR